MTKKRHPFPYNYRAIQSPSGAWDVWLYDENDPCRVASTHASEREAKDIAHQHNLNYELNNIPTP